MNPPIDQASVLAAFNDLGIQYPVDFQAIQRLPFEQGVVQLDALKERVRKTWKKFVFELHPDRTGNDPVKTMRLQVLTDIKTRVEAMTLQPRPPQPQAIPVQRVVMWTPRTGFRATATVSEGSPTQARAPRHGIPFSGVFHVVNMRPDRT